MKSLCQNRLDGWRKHGTFPRFILIQSSYRDKSVSEMRDYARVVNCSKDGHSSCRCPSCVMLSEGVNRNYKEHLGELKVEHLEDLLQDLILVPDKGTRFVILTVPGVSTVLQNKLLKLLEEGMERTVFVFVHTGGKLLEPIRSRSVVLWMPHPDAWEELLGKGSEFSEEELNFMVMASASVPGRFKWFMQYDEIHFFIRLLVQFFSKTFRADLLTKIRTIDEKRFFAAVENSILLALNDPAILKDWNRVTLNRALAVMKRFSYYSTDRVLAAAYMMLQSEG